MGRGQLEGINRLLLFMYGAYALGYLVTLFSSPSPVGAPESTFRSGQRGAPPRCAR